MRAESAWRGLSLAAVGLVLLVSAACSAEGRADSPRLSSQSSGGSVTRALGGYRIELRQAPVGLRISRNGRDLLRSVARTSEGGGVRYAGLGFTTGPVPELAPPTLGQEGAPATGAGKSFAAIGVERTFSGARRLGIVLRTDSPTGRRIRLTVRLNRDRSLTVAARVPGKGASSVHAAFASPRGEAFHGFGGRREGTDLRGSDIDSWVLDYRYPDPTTSYYAPVPGFISSRGYGLLLRGDRFSRWRMSSDRRHAWRVSQAGKRLTLRLAAGGVRKAMSRISALAGRHRLPPAWSTGVTLSRTVGIVGDAAAGGYRSRVEADLARIEKADFPISAYAFEGWQTLPRPFVEQVIARLRERGIHAVLYLRSFVSNDTAGTEGPGTFDQAIAKRLVVTGADGEPYLLPSPFPGAQAVVVDFTKPAAVRWWKRRVQALLNTGADGFMNDFGEQVEAGMRFFDGTPAAVMHNRYPALQAKVTRQAIKAWQRRHPHRRPFFFQRAGYVGTISSTAWENGQFPGDETVGWQRDTGLPSIIPDMLNRAVLGAPGFSTDIGGYAQFTVENPFADPADDELFARWAEAAAFMPFFRVHNSGLSGAKMPWDFGAGAQRAWKRAVGLHQRSRPLTRRLWQRFLKTGVPMVRPLYLVDPAGARGPRGDDQFLLGGNLLVAPVLEEGASSRPVRLPKGCWRREGTGRRLRGARTISVEAPVGRLPWFTRCGTAPLR